MATRSDVTALRDQLAADVATLRAALPPTTAAHAALAGIETFADVTLAVLERTPPGVIASVARTRWIGGLLDGKPEIAP